jgi:hypothetical protein
MGHEGEDMIPRRTVLLVVLAVFLAGCVAGPPVVREGLEENLSAPAGTIEGNQFTGIRYPFKVSAPANWKMSTEFPDFMQSLGYDKPTPYDKEVTELYIFNPSTQSNVQIDLTPADRYTVYSQKAIENYVNMGGSSLAEEWKKEGVQTEIGSTEAVTLKGAKYAAKKYATYTLNGVKREQGWIYGFSEPYLIFILYMVIDKPGSVDHEDVKSIIESFEFMAKK